MRRLRSPVRSPRHKPVLLFNLSASPAILAMFKSSRTRPIQLLPRTSRMLRIIVSSSAVRGRRTVGEFVVRAHRGRGSRAASSRPRALLARLAHARHTYSRWAGSQLFANSIATSLNAASLPLQALPPRILVSTACGAQPRGKQYCEVATDVRELDHNHDWNALPKPEISPETLRRLAAVMPGVQSNLQRHEWIVHGTCFGGNADDYFARASGLAEAVDGSGVAKLFAENVGKSLSAEAIRASFDDAFGAGAGARVTVSCHGRGDHRTITELIINLAGDVRGSSGLGDLMHAAQQVQPGCPSGLVERAPVN